MAKKIIKEMKMEKFTYEIVMNVGNYQSVRIGGEWSVTDAPTTDQVIKIDAELRQKVAEVIESRKAIPAQPQPQPQQEEGKKPEPQPQPQAETKTEEGKKPEPQQEEGKTENKPEPEPQPQPQQVDETLELVPINSPKFQAILKKIQSGTPEEVVRKYFRFDKKGEQVIAIAYSDLIQEHGKRETIKFT